MLCDAPDGRGGTWSEDGTIIFTPDSRIVSLWRVSSAGGTAMPVTTLEPGEVQHKWPQVLPGGNAVLFTSHDSISGFDDARLVVQPLPTGTRKVVQRGGYYGRYLATGHLVYLARGTLFAAPFDLKRAGLILLDANPLDDIHNIRTVRYVIANGVLYPTAKLWESVGFKP